jgi:hypothetical protein
MATFRVPRRGVVHGLAGYFESVLFGDVELSTRPDTMEEKSKDMISWFPIFFPLKVPRRAFPLYLLLRFPIGNRLKFPIYGDLNRVFRRKQGRALTNCKTI